MRKTICLLAYEGVELLDLSGPQSAFYEATLFDDSSYELIAVGFTAQAVNCEAGMQVTPNATIDDIEHCHTLIIPGGKGARSPNITEADLKGLSGLMHKAERVVSICTGAFLMARAGIPMETKVTTHWAFFDMFQNQYPQLHLEEEKLFIRDGKYWSSAGVTSGIDLSLRLIELDLGSEASHHVAKHLVVYVKRTGNQKQFSDLLDVQAPKQNRILSATDWIKANIGSDITVASLSAQLHLSERQCHRLFLTETGVTPAHYVEKIRLQIASELLATTDKNSKSVAAAVGYKTYDGFRRAFERHFSISPSAYRNAFYSSHRDDTPS